jgi:hypothetical protein
LLPEQRFVFWAALSDCTCLQTLHPWDAHICFAETLSERKNGGWKSAQLRKWWECTAATKRSVAICKTETIKRKKHQLLLRMISTQQSFRYKLCEDSRTLAVELAFLRHELNITGMQQSIEKYV